MGFEIDILGVGENSKGGDAIVFRYGDLQSNEPNKQRVIVIDGGYSKNGEELYDTIKNIYNTNSIYFTILTHPDGDHVEGLKTLFAHDDLHIAHLIMSLPWNNQLLSKEYFKDKRITDNSLSERLKKTFSSAYELEQLARRKNVNVLEPEINAYDLEGGAKLTILSPSNNLYIQKMLESDKTPSACEDIRFFSESMDYLQKKDQMEDYYQGSCIKWYDDEPTTAINETSIIALFEYNDIRVLFTGDSGINGLNLALSNARQRSISLENLTIFMVPHHGSRKNMIPDLMSKINATYTFISSPKDGDPHHPSRRLVNKLKEFKHQVYATNGYRMCWGRNCPNRGWLSKQAVPYYSSMEINT
ncbi:hypothetical protein EZS27_033308 [termite gut metagenome]|uniref:Metallo-beta-lactamase domain-containing protein n=1 Tax=termite gut metagenome TaxID=433724 RepID=A0A5J4Q6V3_9ZZZZ